MSEPEDSWDKFEADLAADPDARVYLEDQVVVSAEEFIKVCVRCARRIAQIDDPFRVLEIMADVTIWATELNSQLDRELVVKTKAKGTAEAFKR